MASVIYSLFVSIPLIAQTAGTEWEPLAPLVGRWKGDFAIGTEAASHSTSENEWVLGQRFVRSMIESVDAKGNRMQTMVLWGYDQASKQYTRSFFFSSGGTFHERGTYDAGSKSFNFSDPDVKTGQARTARVQWVDADTLSWQIVLPTKPGSTPLIVRGTNRREKKS